MIPSVRTFQALVVFNWLAVMATTFVPATLFTSNPQVLDLIAMDGIGSMIGNRMINALYWINTLAAFMAAFGLFLFQGWARILFLVMVLANILLGFVCGVRVSYPALGVLGAILSTTDGMIILLSYLQPLSKYFEQRDAGSAPPPPAPDEIVLR